MRWLWCYCCCLLMVCDLLWIGGVGVCCGWCVIVCIVYRCGAFCLSCLCVCVCVVFVFVMSVIRVCFVCAVIVSVCCNVCVCFG